MISRDVGLSGSFLVYEFIFLRIGIGWSTG